jgi:hypothetical protein
VGKVRGNIRYTRREIGTQVADTAIVVKLYSLEIMWVHGLPYRGNKNAEAWSNREPEPIGREQTADHTQFGVRILGKVYVNNARRNRLEETLCVHCPRLTPAGL